MQRRIGNVVNLKAPKTTRTVFLDTNVLKLAATALLRLVPRTQIIDWGHIKSEVRVHDSVYWNPNNGITDPNHRNEAELVHAVADLCRDGRLKPVQQMEAIGESMGLPNMMGGGGFYGVPVESIEAPIQYSRALTWPGEDPGQMTVRFLSGISHVRFKELQKVTGAFQGNGKYSENQLLDAFHIWCAEHNDCDFFLTLDYKLIRLVKSHKLAPKRPSMVSPSELLKNFDETARP